MAINVLIAPNAFKGSISAQEAGLAIQSGLHRSGLDFTSELIPIADGGDGTLEILSQYLKGSIKSRKVKGPNGSIVEARYGISPDAGIGFIELAEASGLRLCKNLTPYSASTFGTGELIGELLDQNCRKIYLGVGGSATSDGGAGILEVLGMRFYSGDELITEIRPDKFSSITTVDPDGLDDRLKNCHVKILTDVENTLCGPEGAVFTYGPQKGIPLDELSDFDELIRHWASLIQPHSSMELLNLVGGGASGGVPAGLFPFMNVELVSGAEEILELSGFHEKLSYADVLITTEGQIDGQTVQGKGPGMVGRLAKEKGAKSVGLCGLVGPDYEIENSCFDAVFSINHRIESLEIMMKSTADNLESTSFNLGRLLSV